MEDVILALDPGREKCGIAVANKNLYILFKGITATSALDVLLKEKLLEFLPEAVILGSGTFSKNVKNQVSGIIKQVNSEKKLSVTLKVIDEKHSTELARKKYFKDHRPRGLWRLVPVSLQVPPEPYDDYAAIVLAERYFKEGEGNPS
ncbi:MAG: pre-16S rRNA-processing nuclease YqgF [Firmicutes bacterium]|nr:pre-16S rRNA-processing nuclease YqgF [Bacillota bacterium]